MAKRTPRTLAFRITERIVASYGGRDGTTTLIRERRKGSELRAVEAVRINADGSESDLLRVYDPEELTRVEPALRGLAGERVLALAGRDQVWRIGDDGPSTVTRLAAIARGQPDRSSLPVVPLPAPEHIPDIQDHRRSAAVEGVVVGWIGGDGAPARRVAGGDLVRPPSFIAPRGD